MMASLNLMHEERLSLQMEIHLMVQTTNPLAYIECLSTLKISVLYLNIPFIAAIERLGRRIASLECFILDNVSIWQVILDILL